MWRDKAERENQETLQQLRGGSHEGGWWKRWINLAFDFSDTTNKESVDGVEAPKTDTRRVTVAGTSQNKAGSREER